MSRQLTTRGVGVILGNLHHSLQVDALRRNILSLLYTVRVHKNVDENSIEVFRDPTSTYAVVQLRNEQQRQFVLSTLKNKRLLEDLSLDGVLQPGQMLEVLPKGERATAEVLSSTDSRRPSRRIHATRSRSSSGSRRMLVSDGSDQEDAESIVKGSGSQDSKEQSTGKSTLGNKKSGKLHVDGALKSPAEQHSPHINFKSPNRSPLLSPPLKSPPRFCFDEYLTVGQFIGSETRNLEFKAGGGRYLHRQAIRDVSKYMCAFLNSEGGSLLIGVNDAGYVVGTVCNHRQEDLLRTQIDDAIKFMTPHVFPCMYFVNFIPVLEEEGEMIEDLKVLEVTVQPGTAGQLYETRKGDVFIRRDGSVQGPLKASQIQEWTKMMVGCKDAEMQKLASELAESKQKEQFLVEQLEELCDSAAPRYHGKRKHDSSTSSTGSGQIETKRMKRAKSIRFCVII